MQVATRNFNFNIAGFLVKILVLFTGLLDTGMVAKLHNQMDLIYDY
jgi:hypothetical protein